MTPIERKARELLAAEYERDSRMFTARIIRNEPYLLGPKFSQALRAIRAIAAALRSAQVPEWQPIETAPRDVQVQLHKAGKQYVGQWAQNPLTGEVAWSLGELGGGDRALIVGPTHWMPLPAAPSPKGESDE